MYGLGVESQEILQLSILITRWMMVIVTWNKLKAKRGLGWESSKECLRFTSDMNGNCLELWMMDCTILNFGQSDSELQNRLSTRGDWPRCICSYRMKRKFDAVCVYLYVQHVVATDAVQVCQCSIVFNPSIVFPGFIRNVGSLQLWIADSFYTYSGTVQSLTCCSQLLKQLSRHTVVALRWRVLTCFIASSELGAWFNPFCKADTADHPWMSSRTTALPPHCK